MIMIVVFLVISVAAVGFFEILDWFDPSTGRRGSGTRVRAGADPNERLDALERALLERALLDRDRGEV